MLLNKAVKDFGRASEGILSPALRDRHLTQEEAAFIEYYLLQLHAMIISSKEKEPPQ